MRSVNVRTFARNFKTVLIRFLILSVLLVAIFHSPVQSQRLEVGGWLGVANYFGDLNANTSFEFVGPGGGVFVRNNLGSRFAFKHGASFGVVAFDDAATNDPHKIQRNLHFKSNVLEFSTQFEFNFFEYIHGHYKKNFTPYLLIGISMFYFNPRAEYEGVWYDLQPLGTEGQNDASYTGLEPYKLINFAIPIGGGFKFNFSRAWSIGVEFGNRKTFTDYLDDVSGVYVSPLSLPGGDDGVAANLADPSREKIGKPGQMRGTSPKNDDYFFGGITISYAFIRLRCPDPKGF